MSEFAERFLQAFIPLFVAIDPIGLTAIFLGLGPGVSSATRRTLARQAAVTGGGVALAFLFLGKAMFIAVGITAGDFQIAGGLILFILAARELVQPAVTGPVRLPDDFGVVPLGMPLIAGPASLTTLMVLEQSLGVAVTLAALVANLVLVVIALAQAHRLGQIVGRRGLRALSKIIALLLAALAIHLIRLGWASGN